MCKNGDCIYRVPSARRNCKGRVQGTLQRRKKKKSTLTSKKQILTEPDSVIDIVKTRIAELCQGPGETAILISSQLPSITYASINEDIKSHPIVKAGLRLVDELIIENIEKEKDKPMSNIFIIIVGQNHFYNLDEKLSALGYLVKAINYSEAFIDELGLSGGKRKKEEQNGNEEKNDSLF